LFSITNNNTNSGSGGAVIFGNQYFFGSTTNRVSTSLEDHYAQLKSELRMVEDLLKKEKSEEDN
jgi:hypothetical protein